MTLQQTEDSNYTYSNMFYNKIVEIEPSVAPLFRDDELVHKLTLVENLEVFILCYVDFEAFIPKLKRMGLKHKSYGVKPKHYPIVRSAFEYIFENVLKDDFTDTLRSQFRDFYDKVAAIMILGSKRK